jgi:hypothetical protein
MWTFSREAVLRVSVNNAWPLKGVSQTRFVERRFRVQSSLTRLRSRTPPPAPALTLRD